MPFDLTGINLITEEDVRRSPHGGIVRLDENAIITPLAQDLARERHIRFERVIRESAPRRLRIVIGADHGGFELKEQLKTFLAELGHDVRDVGTHSTDPVDYPDFAHAVALAVSRRDGNLGIMIDGAGIGSCMVANKVPGIRAAMCYDTATARNSREHNGANVLTLGGKTIPADQAREIVRVWLDSGLTEDRHKRRVAKIDALL